MTCTAQNDIAKRICKDCGTYFPSHAAIKQHRKGNGCPSLDDVGNGNASENKKTKI